MDGKIALEEHWAVDETLHIAGQPVGAGAWWDELRRLLVEFRDQRLAGMDSNGIELAILGLNTPDTVCLAVTGAAGKKTLAHPGRAPRRTLRFWVKLTEGVGMFPAGQSRK